MHINFLLLHDDWTDLRSLTDRESVAVEEDPVAVGTRLRGEEQSTAVRPKRHLIPPAAILLLVLACTDPVPAGDRQREVLSYTASLHVYVY